MIVWARRFGFGGGLLPTRDRRRRHSHPNLPHEWMIARHISPAYLDWLETVARKTSRAPLYTKLQHVKTHLEQARRAPPLSSRCPNRARATLKLAIYIYASASAATDCSRAQDAIPDFALIPSIRSSSLNIGFIHMRIPYSRPSDSGRFVIRNRDSAWSQSRAPRNILSRPT